MTWSIIITAANREKRLADRLQEGGFDAFLPLRTTWRGKFATHAAIKRPVIPGYVFAIIEPHALHAFHADGAIRLLYVPPLAQDALDECVTDWAFDVVEGVFDDPKPRDKDAPTHIRNRKTRRAKRKAVAWEEGLKALLAVMTSQERLAA